MSILDQGGKINARGRLSVTAVAPASPFLVPISRKNHPGSVLPPRQSGDWTDRGFFWFWSRLWPFRNHRFPQTSFRQHAILIRWNGTTLHEGLSVTPVTPLWPRFAGLPLGTPGAKDRRINL